MFGSAQSPTSDRHLGGSFPNFHCLAHFDSSPYSKSTINMGEYGTNHKYTNLEDAQPLLRRHTPFFAIHNEDMRAYLAEFLGTFILVLIGDGVVAQYVLGAGNNGTYLNVNLCWGIALLFGVHFSGGVSGGHLNPAVSTTLAFFGRFEWHKVPGYIIAQTLGAFAAAFVVFSVYYPWFDLVDPERKTTQGIFATYPNPNVPNFSALLNEVVGTALLVGGIFALGDQFNKPASPYSFPGAVALLLTGIGMSFGLNTGYALNPARDFGPRLFTFFAGWGWEVFTASSGYFWIPIVGPFVGGLLGALAYAGLVEGHHPHQ
jgi:MIP family channel proteins